ncbi:MAG: putative ABC transporter permease subunit, partial [bacterium]
MNKFTALLKIQIKEFIGKTLSGINIKNKSLARLTIYMLPLLLSIPVFHISILIFSVFLKTGNPELLITVVYIGAVILMFFLGIPLMVSEFFYTGDLEFLSSLPVTEDKIVFAKLSTIYIFLMIINLVLMGPALFIYGGYQGYSIIYILTLFLVLFGAPFLPLLISAIIIQIISGFLLKFNYKNLFYLITNLIMITSIIVFQLFANRYASNPENLNHVIKGGNSLLNSLGMMFPPGVWLTKMVMGSFWDAGMFLGLHIILFIILKMLSEKIYKKTIQSKQSKNIFSGQVYYKRRSAKYQLIKR